MTEALLPGEYSAHQLSCCDRSENVRLRPTRHIFSYSELVGLELFNDCRCLILISCYKDTLKLYQCVRLLNLKVVSNSSLTCTVITIVMPHCFRQIIDITKLEVLVNLLIC